MIYYHEPSEEEKVQAHLEAEINLLHHKLEIAEDIADHIRLGYFCFGFALAVGIALFFK